jgi:uncharacterized membrane protein YjgN (DUF898 family)
MVLSEKTVFDAQLVTSSSGQIFVARLCVFGSFVCFGFSGSALFFLWLQFLGFELLLFQPWTMNRELA